jgi:hypothetical protein
MKPDQPLFNLWWSAGYLRYDYNEVAEWMGGVWLTSHPPFRILRRAIIRTLVRNRIIT